MKNHCTYRPCVQIEKELTGVLFVFAVLFGMYHYPGVGYLYGLNFSLFGRGLFIGVRKTCR